MSERLRAVLVGAGRMGLGYAEDPVMARHYPYAAHAQVLAAHPRFDWVAVIDPSEQAREAARGRWRVPLAVSSARDLPTGCRLDVAIIATDPSRRAEFLDTLPGLRAVLVEKPLGVDGSAAQAFVDLCRTRGVAVQVNLWRRADTLFRRLAAGELQDRVGPLQGIFGLYGNGLRNNGTHMVDFVRMMAGEIDSAGVPGRARVVPGGPLAGDLQMPFWLRLESGIVALFHPLDFSHYRENALDLWGERGRLEITQEGLRVRFYPRQDNRAMQGEREVASDAPMDLSSTVGDALYHMYTNLADAVEAKAPLWSPGDSALVTARVVDTLYGFGASGRS